jgi:dUTP pyrophosphatase
MSVWYELEICPVNPSIQLKYRDITNCDNENAGVDLYSADNVKVYETVEFIPFGIKVRMLRVKECEKNDCHYWLVPRSSIYKSGLIMANSVGVIDKSYRGEIKAPVWSMTGHSVVQQGDRLFQIVAPDMGWIKEIRIVDSLPETSRGEGGFGSTGK